MRKLLLATSAIVLMGTASVFAQDAPVASPAEKNNTLRPPEAGIDTTRTESTGLGVTAGGATGAIAGAVVGGPIGALVGGFTGAVIGAEAAVPEPAVTYAVRHPVEPVTIQQPIRQGVVIPQEAGLQPIPDYPDYAYTYVNGRPVIVQAQTREIVHSPGYAIPERTISYVQQNPAEPVRVQAQLSAGASLPAEVEVREVPGDPVYGYVYTESGPVLVDQNTRTVVWTGG